MSHAWLLIGTFLVSSIQEQVSSIDGVVEAVPEVISSADSLARADAPEGTAQGPTFIDLVSVARVLARERGLAHVSVEAVRDAIGTRHQFMAREQVIRCQDTGYPCHVLDDGVFVQLESISVSEDRLVFIAAVYVTHQRIGGGLTLCFLDVRVSFVSHENRWVKDHVELVATC